MKWNVKLTQVPTFVTCQITSSICTQLSQCTSSYHTEALCWSDPHVLYKLHLSTQKPHVRSPCNPVCSHVRGTERKSGCCTFTSGTMLVLLVLLSVSSLCARDTCKASREVQTNTSAISMWQSRRMINCLFFIQAKIKNSLTENPFTELKQYEDIDYDSFVSLTGRRDAAQPIGELSVL